MTTAEAFDRFAEKLAYAGERCSMDDDADFQRGLAFERIADMAREVAAEAREQEAQGK